ncbi:MAG: SEC-C metal-binding domain-containing protein [Patescibacteria group bacterium]
MDPEVLKQKVSILMQPCDCGSGKMAGFCHKANETKEIENEPCICGSGKMLKDCCMQNPETHQAAT